MGFILLALGLVLIAEGLVYALAPSLVERLLEMLRALSEEQRRNAGLAALALGLILVWLAFRFRGIGSIFS
ncbi:DUF2065 domain-containing protein [Leisingera sp. M527]|uniref:DUF2065 domain-containing protein n=1 Tax=Leisingera sp. M527 TaxID=2867014 RepID=UPI0021A3162F|nr:DUF2065 domain-containing protein [Leisingera sp. M527]UWQ34096.1 DUF2065 domain-containing protein [Leisingera sp. M527]